MQKKTVVKYLRISPKKLSFLVADYKGIKATQAMKSCEISVKKGAKFIGKAIKACLNLINKEEQEQALVRNLSVNKGPNFKRWRPGGRGAAHPYLKRTSHLEVILEVPETRKKTK